MIMPPIDAHEQTPTSVAMAKAQQRADRLEAGVDLDSGRPIIHEIECVVEDAQRAHRLLTFVAGGKP